jgi:hypothetical protein
MKTHPSFHVNALTLGRLEPSACMRRVRHHPKLPPRLFCRLWHGLGLLIGLLGAIGILAQTPPSFNGPIPTNRSVSLGASATFRITITAGDAPLSIQWRHEGTNVNWATNTTIVLTNVQLVDAGAYDVVVTNLYGAVTSLVARLEVDPTFTIVDDLPSEPGPNSWSSSWGDHDSDGYLDLFVANSADPGVPVASVLYHNGGMANDGTYRFSRQTNAISQATGWTTEGRWGDFDNDGRPDLFLPMYSPPNYQIALGHLFHNDGDGDFSVVSPPPGGGKPSTWFSTWGDYDRDGFLDLLLANFNLTANSLFHNQGGQTFQAVTTGPLVHDARWWGPAGWFDYDEDGNLDAFIRAGIAEPQYDGLYRNLGNGSFERITTAPFVLDWAVKWGGFAWGDYDNDGHTDLLLTRVNPPGVQIYHNDGGGEFSRVPNAAGIQPATTMAATWLDYDNDGFLDLVAVPDTQTGPDAPPYLYRNLGPGGDGWAFRRVATGSLAGQADTWRGCSAADYDNDGFLDIFLANDSTKRNLLFHNNGNSNGWLIVKCIGGGTVGFSNRDAIGANVRVRATFGGSEWTQMRTIGLDASPGQNDPRAHFGLGDATNVTTLRIEWPSGAIEDFANVAPRQLLTIVEPGLRGESSADGQFHLKISGNTNRTYALQASPDLTHWTMVTEVPGLGTGGPVDFVEPGPAQAQRFYRLKWD